MPLSGKHEDHVSAVASRKHQNVSLMYLQSLDGSV